MRRSRLKANFIAVLTGKGVHLLYQLALVPVFLSQWGAEYYGAWLVISTIPTVLAMSNMGLGTAASTRIILAMGKGSDREANAILFSALLMISAIGAIVVGALALVPVAWFHLGAEFPIADVSLIVVLLMAGLALGMLKEPFSGFLIFHKRAHVSYYFNAANELVSLLVAVTLLLNGATALGLASAGLVTRVVMFFCYGAIARPSIPLAAGGYVSFALIRSLFGKGAGFQLSALWQAIFFQGSIWLANALLGPVAAATWGTLRTLSRTGNQLIALINQSVMPELQTAVAKGELPAARKLHAFGLFVTGGIGVCAGIGLILVGPYAYTIWTKSELTVPWLVWPLLSLGILLNSFWWASEIVHRAFNQPWQINSTGVFAAVLAVGAMAALAASSSNIAAFPAGAIVFEAIMAIFVLKRSLALLGDSFGGMVVNALGSLLHIKGLVLNWARPS